MKCNEPKRGSSRDIFGSDYFLELCDTVYAVQL